MARSSKCLNLILIFLSRSYSSYEIRTLAWRTCVSETNRSTSQLLPRCRTYWRNWRCWRVADHPVIFHLASLQLLHGDGTMVEDMSCRSRSAKKTAGGHAHDTGRNKRICEDKQETLAEEQVVTCSRESRTREEYSGIVGLIHAVHPSMIHLCYQLSALGTAAAYKNIDPKPTVQLVGWQEFFALLVMSPDKSGEP